MFALLLSTLFILAIPVHASYSGPIFKKIMVMMFENEGFEVVLNNALWNEAASRGLLLTNLYALTHPSQCNYVAQLGGSLLSCIDDRDYSSNATNLVDLLENNNISWKSYQEDYTPLANGDCNTATNLNSIYWRKHNPFMSFSSITNNISRCNKIVPSVQFDKDAKNGSLPQFIYFTPNINNDAHDTNLTYSGAYLRSFLNYYLPFLSDTLLFVTWDEDERTENNHITGFLIGPGQLPGTRDDGTYYTQYSMTAAIEQNWNLGNLGRFDATANSWLLANLTVNKGNGNDSNNLSSGAIVAISVVSIVAGLAIIFGIGYYCYKRRGTEGETQALRAENASNTRYQNVV